MDTVARREYGMIYLLGLNRNYQNCPVSYWVSLALWTICCLLLLRCLPYTGRVYIGTICFCHVCQMLKAHWISFTCRISLINSCLPPKDILSVAIIIGKCWSSCVTDETIYCSHVGIGDLFIMIAIPWTRSNEPDQTSKYVLKNDLRHSGHSYFDVLFF